MNKRTNLVMKILTYRFRRRETARKGNRWNDD